MVVCFEIRRLLIRAAFFVFPTLLVAQDQDALAERSRQAKQLMSEGRFAEAIPIYRELIRAVPGNPGLILNLGLAQEMSGHPAEAIPQFEQVLKADPANVPALSSLGMARLQTNEPKLAIAPLQKLVAIQPDNRDARGMLAGALLATKRWAEAATQYRKLAAADPNDAKAIYGLGKAYEALAQQSFDRLEKIAPESPWVLALVGDAQVSARQYRSAFFFYKQAQQKNAQLPGLHAAFARVYENTEHPDWAKQEYQNEGGQPKPDCASHAAQCSYAAGKLMETTQLAKSTPENLYWASKAYTGLAAEQFERLGRLPESIEIHALKAEILTGHRQYMEAANEWRAAVKLAPGDARVQHELAVALFMAKDYQGAIPTFEAEVQQAGAPADTQFMLGDSFLRLQQPEKAIAYLQAALKADPQMKPGHASLGLALAQTGKNAEAIPHLERSLAIDTDGSLYYQLARAYQAVGNAEAARSMMAEYQKRQANSREYKGEVARQAQITAPGL